MRFLRLAIVLTAALLVIAGCGSETTTTTASAETERATSTSELALVIPPSTNEREHVEQSVESFTEELESEGYKVVFRSGVLHVEIEGELHTSAGEGLAGVRTFVNSEALNAIDIAEQSDHCDPEKTVEGFTPEVHAELVETGGNPLPPCDGLVFTDQYVTLETGERALPAVDGTGQLVGYWTGSSVRVSTGKD